MRSLLSEGFALMRERVGVYVVFALASGLAAWYVLPRLDLYDVLANHPLWLPRTPPVSIVLGLALVAVFFIVPSALRRIEPEFRMNGLRITLAAVTLLSVAIVTELGYAFAVLPGIVLSVLLSQALVGGLLRLRKDAGIRGIAAALVESSRGSIAMTRQHFATTLAVLVASLGILIVPFTLVTLALLVLGVRVPPSLVVMTPVLFLTFIYFECVRYAMLVRWYRRLATA
jgi:hypothetical protein